MASRAVIMTLYGLGRLRGLLKRAFARGINQGDLSIPHQYSTNTIITFSDPVPISLKSSPSSEEIGGLDEQLVGVKLAFAEEFVVTKIKVSIHLIRDNLGAKVGILLVVYPWNILIRRSVTLVVMFKSYNYHE